MTLHTITDFYTEWFSFCPNITSTLGTIAMFKCFNEIKQQFKQKLEVCAWSFTKPNIIYLSSTVHELSP